ncbi:MAG: hypothetical protein M5U09_22990 [Gammaproteobacteria bacterium]|nr:hypothetical protein [Gammaproteobacteria bacterium]
MIGDWAPDVPSKPRGPDQQLVRQPRRTDHAALPGGVLRHDQPCRRPGRPGAAGAEPVRVGAGHVGDLRSDHGEMLGDHHLFRKSVPYEGSARCHWWPAPKWMGCPEETVSDLPIGWQDICPTILDAAGGRPSDTADGRASRQLMQAVKPQPMATICTLSTRAMPYTGHATCDGRWKYVWAAVQRHRAFTSTSQPDLQERHTCRPRVRTRWPPAGRSRLEHLGATGPDSPVEDGKLVAGRSGAKRSCRTVGRHQQ